MSPVQTVSFLEAEMAYQGDNIGLVITKQHLKQASVFWDKVETRTTHSELLSQNIRGRNFLHVSHLSEFINGLPGPLGKAESPLNKLEMAAFIKGLLLPQHNNCVHYVDTMCALTYAVLAPLSQDFEQEVAELPNANEQHQLVLKSTKRYYPELFTAARAHFTAHDVLYVIFIQARWRGVLQRRGGNWKPRTIKRYRSSDIKYWLQKGSELTKSTKDSLSKTAEGAVNLTMQGVNMTKEQLARAADGISSLLPEAQPAHRRRQQQSSLVGPNSSQLKRGQARVLHLIDTNDETELTTPTHARKLSRGKIGQLRSGEGLSPRFEFTLPALEAGDSEDEGDEGEDGMAEEEEQAPGTVEVSQEKLSI